MPVYMLNALFFHVPLIRQSFMDHLKPYEPRSVLALPAIEQEGWQLKRYGVLSKNKTFDPLIAVSALDAAIERLPAAGKLGDPSGNHGVGFQLVHFAEVAVVSPVFYWQWGSVLANTNQMRAPWDNASRFKTGVKEVVGCVWEMQIVCFETQSWKEMMLGGHGTPAEKLRRYLDCCLPSAEKL